MLLHFFFFTKNYQRRDTHSIYHQQVVCFRSPTDPAKIFIKRVLAKEGEWIPVDQDGITVPFQVPKGHTWVEGDNTFHSYDSRLLGPIPLGLMLGKATHVVWPPHKFSKIDTTVTERRNV
uniref:Mitochondrial inner membrane protease subunit 2 n=1 Tax=Lygus hesperus TaxID=30085 RepID=A0A0A9W6C1_LYGHE